MRFEVRIALIYFSIGSLWIIGSDAVASILFGQGNTDSLFEIVQTNKGLAYVLVTSLLLYFLVREDAGLRRKQESNYELLFTHHPSTMWVYDATTLRFLEVNERAIQTYGYSRDEFLQMTIKDLHPPEERVLVTNFLTQPRLTKFRIHEWQHQTRAGDIVNVEIASQQLEYNGRLAALVVVRDITERKQLQAERAVNDTLRIELEREQEAYATRSRFFSMVSHDFKTPIATITSAASFLQRYDDGRIDEDKRKDRYETIVNHANHLSEQLDELLIVLRTEMASSNYQPQPHDIVALCQEVVDSLSVNANHAQRMKFTAHYETLMAEIDTKLMLRVVTNLVSNALKYSADDKSVHISLTATDTAVEISVKDEGIGIPADELKHLFEPFFRAKNVNTIQGTGLGLTIVKQAVELHGGNVIVDTIENQGTTFTISLPLHQPALIGMD